MTSKSKKQSGGIDKSNVPEIPEFKHIPIMLELPQLDSSIFSNESNVLFSTNIDYPRAEYGFHHFIHANKNKMEILKQFEGKRKVYLVMNKFERYVDNYEENIGNVSKKFFSLSNKPDILSRGFYKLWEILLLFDLIDNKNANFTSAHLAEGPGSFIQATMFYRDMYCNKGISKNDKYYAVTLHPEDVGGQNHVPELETKFVEYYNKEKPQRFMLHKTYTKEQSGGAKDKDNGDITNPKTIKLFGGQMIEKADLVTGDGGFEWINENVQEQEAYKLIIAQIVAASKIQKKGGNFVCKFFETFTKTSIKIVSILSQLYSKVYFVKPLMSRSSNSEKYAVCTGFKYDDKHKDFKNISKKLDDILKSLHDNKNKQDKLVDIFPDYVVPKHFVNSIIELNRLISNQQLKGINEIVRFVKREIYSGDEYHEKREEQIEGSKYWINMFFQKSLNDTKEQYKNIVQNILIKATNETKELEEKLVFVESQN
jgi:23S rRNA U2552 (ribose-2'-O)-methylase RlmE/FtsJ